MAAQAEINNTPAPNLMEAAEVYARLDSLGDVPATLKRGSRERLAELYAGVDLQVLFEPGGSTAEISMRVNSECVRGASCTLTTRLRLVVPQCPSSSADRGLAALQARHRA